MSSNANFDAVNLQPVRFLANESAQATPKAGIALCLSGGGYRAMVFHLGTIWRLNELGYLKKLVRVSSVSGGSITSGALGMGWKKLSFDGNGVATNLTDIVIKPVLNLASHTIDAFAIVEGIVS